MFYRGINSIDSPKAEFIWEGADGTRALVSRFSTMPRYNFYFYIYRPVVHNEFPNDIEFKWQTGGVFFHFADKEMFDEDYFISRPIDKYFKENIKQQVEKLIKDQANDFTTPHIIWMEGHDSSGPNIKTLRIIQDIKSLIPELNVIHSTLEDYSRLLKESINLSNLSLVKGERRSSQFDLRSGNLYGYTTSARMYLKQKNFEAERWLQFYAEPFNSIAGILGMDINDKYIDLAWDCLIQNSAHDSIGGCSLDEVHEDMIWRYKQVIEISKGVFERACKFLALKINTSLYRIHFYPPFSEVGKGIFLVALNPTTYLRNEIVETFIDIPQEFDKGHFKLMVLPLIV
ncbi:MAG: hypothetical protein KJ666_15410 [Bacteroidetes bacterium]|nr:hypothetical protein [Bacteroidota bacterium]MBU2586135.1 hypothetical protein [Bacteroidota bacterium]